MKRCYFTICVLLSAAILLTACGIRNSVGGRESALQRNQEGTSLVLNGEGSSPAELYPALVGYLGTPRWGYIDNSGKFVLQPVFSSAGRFQANGLAVAGKDGKAGLINTEGKFVVAPAYQNISDFSDGLAVAQDESGFLVLDAHGSVLSEKYPYIGQYKEGRAPFYINMQDGNILYGYLGENGQPAIQPTYEYVLDFDGGLAVVKLPNDGYAIIDRSGKTLKSLNYSYVMGISEGMIPFVPVQGGKYGYLNTKGDVVIEPAFLTAEGFKDGTAVVNASADFSVNKIGLIDKNGHYLIKPLYNEILQLGEGMVALGLAIDPKNIFAGSKYALATKDGTILTDFIFYGMEPFQKGVASVHDNASTWFIDKQGNKVEQLVSADGIGKLELLDSLVYADIDRRPYYTTRQGDVVYRPSPAITLRSGVKVAEEKYRPNRNYLVYYPVLYSLPDLKVQESVNLKLRDMWIDKKIKPTDNLDYSYEGDFKIGFNRKNLLELQKSAYDYPFGAAHGMPIMEYAHVDTKTGTFYKLEDLFKDGSDYIGVLSAIVKEQIKEHGEEMGVWPDSYKGIKHDQPFFLSGDALMLYFEPYEIAPYSSGFPTFTIPFTDISDIIDKKGSFWLSFN